MKSYPKIPIIFSERVPPTFVNDLDGWSLTEERVKSSKGKLIHLDIDFGMACSLNCPMCFRKDGNLDQYKPYLDFDLLTKSILEARGLGLESVRILGAGEPFETKRIVEFLEWLKSEGLKSVVFTQGHTIDGKLAEKLKETNTSIMIRYDSFDEQVVDHSLGIKGVKRKKDDALEILVSRGFNQHNPTHLGIVAPLTAYTSEGVVDVYTFFRDRNIYPLIPFIACAGRSVFPDGSIKDDISENEKIDIAIKIYRYNLQKGIPYDGVSAYPGTHICTLLSNGFYLTLAGLALRCEGDDTSVIGDLRKQSITEIWRNSQNNRIFGGKYNYGCPPKAGRSIPKDFYKKVRERIASIEDPA